MRAPQPISDEDYAKLVAVLGDRLTRDFAESIIGNAAQLCGFREVFGQDSRVAKTIEEVSPEKRIVKMSMFEGRKHSFTVEYNPKTEVITRVL